ncbi:MAG: hypothetical protein COV00_02010 [Candidatus Tagabacteria bacterium CG10_big_fil_rev_8_21_14_0_10_40_13]|nr:MAG: hypothetical protein COV00_02010 [Candidatus Tagabacteria bacterium CG10_big_fil_rev_8_21_14_0_10_40_13]
MVGTPLTRWFEKQGFARGKNLFCYDRGKKEFSDDISEARIVFICVPTPACSDDSCDTSIVKSVVKDLPDGKIVVIKSTVPPGTTARLAREYEKKIFLFNPEFLTEAQAWDDFRRPNLQIVAPADEKARKWAGIILDLLPKGYFQSPFGNKNTYQFYNLNSTQAEIGKYAINQFGAMKVTFFNILYDRCKNWDVDFEDVRAMVTHDSRIASSWSDPLHGDVRGYNGFCFPKDTKAILFEDRTFLEKKTGLMELTFCEAAILFFRAMDNYNEILHHFQGTSVAEMSVHDKERRKINE